MKPEAESPRGGAPHVVGQVEVVVRVECAVATSMAPSQGSLRGAEGQQRTSSGSKTLDVEEREWRSSLTVTVHEAQVSG
jgi:hypothetical protein